jgi:hypothetical protein
MSNAASAPPKRLGRTPRVLALSVVVALCVFGATYATYFVRAHTRTPGSYVPLIVGLSVYFVIMASLHYLASATQATWQRAAKAVGLALAESLTFFFLFLFVVVNTLGS